MNPNFRLEKNTPNIKRPFIYKMERQRERRVHVRVRSQTYISSIYECISIYIKGCTIFVVKLPLAFESTTYNIIIYTIISSTHANAIGSSPIFAPTESQ